jgi:hypothetical protein
MPTNVLLPAPDAPIIAKSSPGLATPFTLTSLNSQSFFDPPKCLLLTIVNDMSLSFFGFFKARITFGVCKNIDILP